jgi:hypothetical protein
MIRVLDHVARAVARSVRFVSGRPVARQPARRRVGNARLECRILNAIRREGNP